jgi:hypothetical protein
MRSNNAVALLPFNIFEFTLLAEVIATEADLDLGPFRVDAMSMHLYSRDEKRARQILEESGPSEGQMPRIPPRSQPLEQINLLARLEADLRHEQQGLAEESPEKVRARGEGLDGYWQPFFDVLLVGALAKAGRSELAKEVADHLPAHFAQLIRTDLEKRVAAEDKGEEPDGDLRLFRSPAPGENVAAALRDQSIDVEHLHALLDEIELAQNLRLGHHEADIVLRALEEEKVDIAARSEDGGAANDFRGLDREDVLRVIRKLGLGE